MENKNCECITKQDIKNFFKGVWVIICVIGFISVLIFPAYHWGKDIGFRDGQDNQKGYYKAFYDCEHK